MNCQHKAFDCNCTVNRLEDVQRFCMDVTVTCAECGEKFRFIGLPAGLDLNGASVSVDGTEGHFAIAPRSEVWTPLENTSTGFTVRKTQ